MILNLAKVVIDGFFIQWYNGVIKRAYVTKAY